MSKRIEMEKDLEKLLIQSLQGFYIPLEAFLF